MREQGNFRTLSDRGATGMAGGLSSSISGICWGWLRFSANPVKPALPQPKRLLFRKLPICCPAIPRFTVDLHACSGRPA